MSPRRAALVAALAGFAVLAIELAAVRLFAPSFGDSAYVWTNVIGVLLVALAGGAWLGGRLAVAGREPRRLRQVLLVAAVIVAVVPFVAPWLGRLLVPEGLALEHAGRVLVLGSLAATLLAFAAPVGLAGAATPLLVAALAHARVDAGRASGLVGAFGTLGSLAGTFLTTHVLVPELGSRATIWIAAACLGLAAWVAAPARGAALVAMLLALVPLAPQGPLRPANAGEELLAEVESAYQFLQVARLPARDAEPAATVLRINEGLDSFHSIKLDGMPWTNRRYYDWFVALPRALDDAAARSGPRVLSLGAAAGTFERLFRARYPAGTTHSVEIDPAVTRLGRAWFSAFDDGEVDAGLDARVFVEIASSSFDLVLVDCYERQVYVPAHVASREFFAAVARRLAAGGLVAINCGGVRFDDPVVSAIAGTLASVFGSAHAFRVPASRNVLIVARLGAAFEPTRLAPLASDPEPLRAVDELLADPRRWRQFGPAEEPLVDDRPLLDALHEDSLAGRSGATALIPIAGSSSATVAEAAAYDAMLHGDHEAALASVGTASAESWYLRFLAGDARWALHDVQGADLEYARALELEPPADEAALLTARRASATTELAAIERARAAGVRNGGLALGTGLLIALLFGLTLRRLGPVAAPA
ncbi:MAG: fused MFS/spermidine synthase [Planctomycetes bacterium]|nr:fused MFS/spermidine synthase [Planctomycetota bacterium]